MARFTLGRKEAYLSVTIADGDKGYRAELQEALDAASRNRERAEDELVPMYWDQLVVGKQDHRHKRWSRMAGLWVTRLRERGTIQGLARLVSQDTTSARLAIARLWRTWLMDFRPSWT